MKTSIILLALSVCFSVYASNEEVTTDIPPKESFINPDSTFVPDTSLINVLVTYGDGYLSIVPAFQYGTCYLLIEKSDSNLKFREFVNLSKGKIRLDYDLEVGQYTISIYGTKGQYRTELTIL